MRRGRLSLSAALLAGGLALSPGHVAFGAALDDAAAGVSAYHAGRLQEAADKLTQALASSDLSEADRVTAFNNRAVVWDALGQPDKAVEDYEAALKLRPDDEPIKTNLVRALLRRGDAAIKSGNRSAAKRDYDRSITLQPDLAAAHARRGAMLLAQGDLEAARSDLEAAKRLNPGDQSVDVLLQRAQAPAAATTPQGSARYRVVKTVSVRGGPGKTSPVIGVLHAGDTIEGIGITNGWIALRTKDGTLGYAYNSFFERAS